VIDSNSMWCLTTSFIRASLVDSSLNSLQILESLLPILALYLLPFLHILEKQLKNLKIPISVLLFVDNGLLVAQSKFFQLFNSHLFCSYNIVSILLSDFGLLVKHSKTEIFHFSRSISLFNTLLTFHLLVVPL